MILADISAYLRSRQQVSLHDLAIHFDAEPDAVRAMLEFLISKGRVSRVTVAACSSNCNSCAPASMELFAWGKQPLTSHQGMPVLCHKG